jgi:hypothetical protein
VLLRRAKHGGEGMSLLHHVSVKTVFLCKKRHIYMTFGAPASALFRVRAYILFFKTYKINKVNIKQPHRLKINNAGWLKKIIIMSKEISKKLVITSTIQGPPDDIAGNYFDPITSKWWVPYAFVTNPVNWGAVHANPTGVPVLFIDHFNTDVTGESGWTVGYLDETIIPYGTDLDTITCDQIKKSFKYLESFQKNVIGWTHDEGTDHYEGYFRGDKTTHNFEIYRIIAITSGSYVYLIKVTIQDVDFIPVPPDPIETSYWRSSITYQYIGISCNIPPVPEDDPVFQLVQGFIQAKLKK